MKKIPTLFVMEYEGNKRKITKEVTPGMEWVLDGKGIATVKYDGSAIAIIGGRFYKRYDAKKGRKPPEGAIPCCDPDPITGHHPHWVEIDLFASENKWHHLAIQNFIFDKINEGKTREEILATEGTYEAIGSHFQGNPYQLVSEIIVKHGEDVVEVERTFDGIKKFLQNHAIEGLVFWKDGEPQCKIRRKDFGIEWKTGEARAPIAGYATIRTNDPATLPAGNGQALVFDLDTGNDRAESGHERQVLVLGKTPVTGEMRTFSRWKEEQEKGLENNKEIGGKHEKDRSR